MRAELVGKRMRGALYVHAYAIPLLSPVERALIARAEAMTSAFEWNVVRLEPAGVVGLLQYPDFETEAFPRLRAAARVDVDGGQLRKTNYANSSNPLVLHRKEMLVGHRHPKHQEWTETTRRIEALGLLVDRNRIGRLVAWSQLLADAGLDKDGRPAG